MGENFKLLIDKYGAVFARIIEVCIAHGIKELKFEEIQKGLRVTIYKEKLNEGIKTLYKYISENPMTRVSQLEKELNIPAKTLERWIKQLRDEDKIEFRGSKKTGGLKIVCMIFLLTAKI